MNTFIRNILILILFLKITFVETTAQSNNYNFSQFGEETLDFIKAPSKWNYKDALKLVATFGSTIILMNFDEDVRTFALQNNQYSYSLLSQFGKYWGEPLTTLTFAATFGLYGITTCNNANKQLAFEVIQSGFYTSIVTGSLKYSLGRARPFTGADAFTFKPFSFNGDSFLSFSSGHTALAFSLSTIISLNSNSNYLKVIAYIPAFLTAASRVYQNFHWTSDVFFGACVGYFIGSFVHNLHKEEASANQPIMPPPPAISLSIPL